MSNSALRGDEATVQPYISNTGPLLASPQDGGEVILYASCPSTHFPFLLMMTREFSFQPRGGAPQNHRTNGSSSAALGDMIRYRPSVSPKSYLYSGSDDQISPPTYIGRMDWRILFALSTLCARSLALGDTVQPKDFRRFWREGIWRHVTSSHDLWAGR